MAGSNTGARSWRPPGIAGRGPGGRGRGHRGGRGLGPHRHRPETRVHVEPRPAAVLPHCMADEWTGHLADRLTVDRFAEHGADRQHDVGAGGLHTTLDPVGITRRVVRGDVLHRARRDPADCAWLGPDQRVPAVVPELLRLPPVGARAEHEGGSGGSVEQAVVARQRRVGAERARHVGLDEHLPERLLRDIAPRLDAMARSVRDRQVELELHEPAPGGRSVIAARARLGPHPRAEIAEVLGRRGLARIEHRAGERAGLQPVTLDVEQELQVVERLDEPDPCAAVVPYPEPELGTCAPVEPRTVERQRCARLGARLHPQHSRRRARLGHRRSRRHERCDQHDARHRHHVHRLPCGGHPAASLAATQVHFRPQSRTAHRADSSRAAAGSTARRATSNQATRPPAWR